MITTLHVRQFALFESIDLELSSGTTVFTGETGAGKSILVNALGAVFGARAKADWVRHGAEKSEIIAEIESSDRRLLALLHEHEIDSDEGIIIRRTVTAEGRSRAWINGTPAPISLLKKIGHICFDLHGQHEHQALLQADFQQQIIDARVDENCKKKVHETFLALQGINTQLNNLQGNHDQALQQESWMREERESLLNLELEEGLEDILEAHGEANRHMEQVQQAATIALTLFDEQEASVRNLLGQAMQQVNSVATHHPSLQEAREILTQMETLAGEVPPYLQDVLDTPVDNEKYMQAEDRLAALRTAKRRHHTDELGLIELLSTWENTLNALDTASWDEEALRNQQQAYKQNYQQAATTLHESRQQAAVQLMASLRPFLDQLGLKSMHLKAAIIPLDDERNWRVDGWDHIEILATANLGEPFKSLSDTASGGELSRLILALKGCGALEHMPDTAIFDEVDVGIGGETAWCVGELLRNMGHERQVLVVSHLPQVAACAQHQVAIKKSTRGNRTDTQLVMLQNHERKNEIARMLGGINKESLHHAAQMLARGS